MRRNRSAFRLAVVLAAFAATATGAGSSAVSRAAVSTCGSLSFETGPSAGNSGGGSDLTDVSYVSASESWAVGDEFNSALRAHQTLIERFDGSAWSVIPSPDQSKLNNGLISVSMTSGGGWAAGYALQGTGSRPEYRPLAMHWGGAQWALASPTGFTGDAVLTGVDALADGTAWAAGFQTTAAGTRRTLIESESGGTWTPAASPDDGTATSDNTLTGIGGTATTGLWAVGYRQSPAGLKPVILRYDTTLSAPSWVSVSGAGGVPSPGQLETVLTGVDVRTASDVWAVGYYDDGGGQQPLALHWDGSAWSSSPVPGIGILRQVRAVAPGNVWATGAYYDASKHRTRTLLVHFNGTAWSTAVSADGSSPDELVGVATNPTGSALTLVGSTGETPLIEQASCPTGPVSLATRTAPAPAPAPVPPGVGPAPSPPPPTPPAKDPVPVTITDQAAAAGIQENGTLDKTWSAAITDFNGDGWPDMFVGQHAHVGHLWINNQDGTFHEIDAGYFAGIDRHDCIAADFSQDGREDMFCSVGADRGTGLKSNALYIQQPDGTFVDQAWQQNVSDPEGRGRHSAVLDANNDGYPDIFSGSDSQRPDGLPAQNRLFLNTGHGSFIDSPAMGLDLGIGSGCAHTVDYNRDGWPDLLVCGATDTGPLALHLFRNDQGRGFTDVSSILGPLVNAMDAVMVDVNHDNTADLITLTKTTLAERLQRPDGTFASPQTLMTVQDGRSLAVGDVNGDNNPDIYVVGGRAGSVNAPDYLLLGDATGGFTQQPIPEATVGKGDRAYPIDYNRDGLTDFLVLNGADSYPGEIQLLSPAPPETAAAWPGQPEIGRASCRERV